jgi:hypothetical protein
MEDRKMEFWNDRVMEYWKYGMLKYHRSSGVSLLLTLRNLDRLNYADSIVFSKPSFVLTGNYLPKAFFIF